MLSEGLNCLIYVTSRVRKQDISVTEFTKSVTSHVLQHVIEIFFG